MPNEITFKLKLTDKAADISRHILEAVAEEFNIILRSIVNSVRVAVKAHVHSFFQFSETYKSLNGGLLMGHFGFPKGTENSRANAVLNAVADTTEVIFNRINVQGTRLVGGLVIRIGSKEYEQYLSLPEAKVVYTDKEGRNVELPWLDWLLTQGDKIIIADYNIRFGPSKYSRSGFALMVEDKTKDKRLGYAWRVPPEFSGTPERNWITKTLNERRDQLFQAINNDLQTLIESQF